MIYGFMIYVFMIYGFMIYGFMIYGSMIYSFMICDFHVYFSSAMWLFRYCSNRSAHFTALTVRKHNA